MIAGAKELKQAWTLLITIEKLGDLGVAVIQLFSISRVNRYSLYGCYKTQIVSGAIRGNLSCGFIKAKNKHGHFPLQHFSKNFLVKIGTKNNSLMQ